MLKPVQITRNEEELLLEWRRSGANALVRDRAHSILLNLQGRSSYSISKILYRNPDTVRNWLDRFRKRRISSFFTKYRGNNNAGKLTKSQKKKIRKVLSQPPSEYGIPKEFWQLKDLKKWIRTEFGVVYESDRSYHFLFKLGRFSWKLPSRFDIKRDNQFVKKRVKEIKEEIKPFLASSDWVVLASDETRLVWESESRRAWLRTNQKTILKVNRSKDYQSFLGSLNLKTGKCHLHSLSWQNQEETFFHTPGVINRLHLGLSEIFSCHKWHHYNLAMKYNIPSVFFPRVNIYNNRLSRVIREILLALDKAR